jgi:hypothetical protein
MHFQKMHDFKGKITILNTNLRFYQKLNFVFTNRFFKSHILKSIILNRTFGFAILNVFAFYNNQLRSMLLELIIINSMNNRKL